MKKKNYPTYEDFTNFISTYSENDMVPFLSHYKGDYSSFRILIVAFWGCLEQVNETIYNNMINSQAFLDVLLECAVDDAELSKKASEAFVLNYGIKNGTQFMPLRTHIADQLDVSVKTVNAYIRKVTQALNRPICRKIIISEVINMVGVSNYFTRPLDMPNKFQVACQLIDDCQLDLEYGDNGSDNCSSAFYAMMGKLFDYGSDYARITSRMVYEGFEDEVIWKIRCDNNWISKLPSEYDKPPIRHNKRYWVNYIRKHNSEITGELKYAYCNAKVPYSIICKLLNVIRKGKTK